MVQTLGKLKEITNLREVWPHEALDFTPWLAEEENLEMLSDAVGLEISLDETESAVGEFSVDILATETGTERKIVIENQLEDTNHDHLGKLITYASGKGADIVIWVVKHAREEHRAAIEWLNNHTDENVSFFLCEVKLYQIGNSEPAVKFEVIEKPNDWVKEIKRSATVTSTQQFRLEYWNEFNEYAFAIDKFAKEFNKRKPSTDHWMSLYIGSSACHIAILQQIKRQQVEIEIYINDDKELYHELLNNKESIEAESGLHFDWRELPEKKASRIIIGHKADFDNSEQRKEQFAWIVETCLKMKKAFKKYI